MSALRKLLFSLGLLALVLPAVSIAGTGTASAGLSPGRTCHDFYPGNGRMLSVCVRYWVSDPGATVAQSRGVVEMHAYKLVAGGGLVDIVAQSITLNRAQFLPRSAGVYTFGMEAGQTTCRVNAPNGSQTSCSVPNVTRVAFYSKAYNAHASSYSTRVTDVSFRDDLGQPHRFATDFSYP